MSSSSCYTLDCTSLSCLWILALTLIRWTWLFFRRSSSRLMCLTLAESCLTANKAGKTWLRFKNDQHWVPLRLFPPCTQPAPSTSWSSQMTPPWLDSCLAGLWCGEVRAPWKCLQDNGDGCGPQEDLLLLLSWHCQCGILLKFVAETCLQSIWTKMSRHKNSLFPATKWQNGWSSLWSTALLSVHVKKLIWSSLVIILTILLTNLELHLLW